MKRCYFFICCMLTGDDDDESKEKDKTEKDTKDKNPTL